MDTKVQDATNPAIYYLNFHYHALNPVYITIYYCIKEIVEEATQINKGLLFFSLLKLILLGLDS